MVNLCSFSLLRTNNWLEKERLANTAIRVFTFTQGTVALPSPATPGQRSAHPGGHAGSPRGTGLSQLLGRPFPKGAPRPLRLSTRALCGLGACRDVWHRAEERWRPPWNNNKMQCGRRSSEKSQSRTVLQPSWSTLSLGTLRYGIFLHLGSSAH